MVFSKRIIAVGNVKSAVKIGEDFSYRTDFLQNSLKQTEGLSLQGLLIALAFGERAWLDNKTWLIYQQTNTAHLIAISGLHIGLAMGIGFFFARLLATLTAYTLYFTLVSALLWCVDCLRLRLFSWI